MTEKSGEDGLPEAFWAVARQLRHASRDTLDPLDVTPSQARAMVVLGRHGPVRQRVLADHLRIAPRSVTEVVDALEARGLLTRDPDPEDRRATLVTLTPAGRETMTEIRRLRMDENASFFARLSATDRSHLARILARLRD